MEVTFHISPPTAHHFCQQIAPAPVPKQGLLGAREQLRFRGGNPEAAQRHQDFKDSWLEDWETVGMIFIQKRAGWKLCLMDRLHFPNPDVTSTRVTENELGFFLVCFPFSVF
jgi:hypothetical protein